MLVMALCTFHEAFFERVMGLSIFLSSDVQMTGIAERGFPGLQIFVRTGMSSMARIAGNTLRFVPAKIPKRNGS